MSEDRGVDAEADGDGGEGDEYNEVMALRKTVGSNGFEIGRDKIAEQETK